MGGSRRPVMMPVVVMVMPGMARVVIGHERFSLHNVIMLHK